jgi:hypothetical protein
VNSNKVISARCAYLLKHPSHPENDFRIELFSLFWRVKVAWRGNCKNVLVFHHAALTRQSVQAVLNVVYVFAQLFGEAHGRNPFPMDQKAKLTVNSDHEVRARFSKRRRLALRGLGLRILPPISIFCHGFIGSTHPTR